MDGLKILVVDDEAIQRDLLSGFLRKQGYSVATAENGRTAMDRFRREPFHLVLLDHRMPDRTGDQVLAGMKAENPAVRAVMITAYGTVDTAVDVMKLGADDFLEKPVDLSVLLEKIKALEASLTVAEEADEAVETLAEADLPIRIIGESPAIRGVLSLVRRIAPTPYTVLVRGETGTGKELIARLIHLLSSVSEGPFVTVNCGAVPETLFESELFGHEKGAFTGAAATRRGRFEAAAGGTLFLDEIGELPLTLQPKLLRALQELMITRVGGEREIPVDVRVVAATNRDLKALIAGGAFREDLYHRLHVFDVELPPLRARKADISELAGFFAERYSLGRPVRLDADALNTLMRYPFPGNVRELEHVIQRTVTLCRGSVVRDRDLPPEIRFHQAGTDGSLAQRLDAVEREMILTALEGADWVQTRAAETLGISERVLRYKMTKHGIRKTGRAE